MVATECRISHKDTQHTGKCRKNKTETTQT